MGFDQLVSLDSSVDATEYLLLKGDSFNSIENALIIADQDGTKVNLNGDTNTFISLDAGEHLFIEGDKFLKTPIQKSIIYISSPTRTSMFSKELEKGGTIGSLGSGQDVHWYGANQGMFFVPPLSCTSVGDGSITELTR